AGGSDEAMSFGVDLLPTQMTRLGLQMDYDNLRYDMRYEKNSNTSGLGGTITLDQIVARRLKFSLLASDRKPYQEYQAGIKWLADNAPGNVLEIGLSGTHIAGSHGIDNDNRVDLDLTYSWDSDTMGDFTYYGSFGEDNSQQALRSWTAAPAVHMEQVLAVRDEKVQQVVTSKQSFVAAQAISIPVVPGNVRVELSKYIANSAFDDHWQVSGLPSELHYENGVISGKLTKQDVGKHFSVALVPASNDGAKPCALNLQVVPQGDVPAPMSDNCPPDVSYSPGETITPLQYAGHYNPESSPKGLFYDDIWEFNSLSLTVTGLKDGDFDSGLKANYAPNDESGILTIQGTVSSVPHVYHVKIYATNLFGESTKTQDFTITVGKQIPLPSVNVSKQPTYTEGDRVTNDEIATASAGNGSVFDDASAITVTAEDTQGHYYPLSDFNLSDEIKLSADHTSATIDLQDKDATGAAHPEKSAQNYVIQATNHDGQQAKNTFLLTVNTAPSPTVTISKSNPTYTEGDMPSETIATAYAGKGELFDTSSANTIQVKAVDGSNNKYDLSHFNLQAVVQYSDDQHATITLKNIDGKKVVASQDSPQRYEIKATNKASKVATDDFTLTVHPFAGTAYLQCPSTLHKDSDPTWVVGESEDTRGDNYVFSTHLQSELPDSALKELELFNARYEEGTMYCVYTSKSIGHIMVQAGGVPKHQAENIQFTHPDQSKYMCKGQVDYCQLQYDE
ncbi:MAG: hypothetical protein KKH06_00720, partial [Gammaproteobacteria bacterium]|nr:hypothetical protein [Gammaproteobacteria bacterium]